MGGVVTLASQADRPDPRHAKARGDAAEKGMPGLGRQFGGKGANIFHKLRGKHGDQRLLVQNRLEFELGTPSDTLVQRLANAAVQFEQSSGQGLVERVQAIKAGRTADGSLLGQPVDIGEGGGFGAAERGQGADMIALGQLVAGDFLYEPRGRLQRAFIGAGGEQDIAVADPGLHIGVRPADGTIGCADRFFVPSAFGEKLGIGVEERRGLDPAIEGGSDDGNGVVQTLPGAGGVREGRQQLGIVGILAERFIERVELIGGPACMEDLRHIVLQGDIARLFAQSLIEQAPRSFRLSEPIGRPRLFLQDRDGPWPQPGGLRQGGIGLFQPSLLHQRPGEIKGRQGG